MLRNIYGQKQAGRVWNKYLHGILLRLGFVQSQVDEGVYYRDGVMYLLYTDDTLLASKSEEKNQPGNKGYPRLRAENYDRRRIRRILGGSYTPNNRWQLHNDATEPGESDLQ